MRLILSLGSPSAKALGGVHKDAAAVPSIPVITVRRSIVISPELCCNVLRQVADPTLVGVAIPHPAVLEVQSVQGWISRLVQHDLGDDGAIRHLQLVDFRFISAHAPDMMAFQRDAVAAYRWRLD